MPTYVTDNVIEPWITISANSPSKQAVVGDKINGNTSSATRGSFTLLLPQGPLTQNDQVIIRDPRTEPGTVTAGFYGWRTNNLTISAAQPINGFIGTFICDVQGATLVFSYWNTSIGWRVYAY